MQNKSGVFTPLYFKAIVLTLVGSILLFKQYE